MQALNQITFDHRLAGRGNESALSAVKLHAGMLESGALVTVDEAGWRVRILPTG